MINNMFGNRFFIVAREQWWTRLKTTQCFYIMSSYWIILSQGRRVLFPDFLPGASLFRAPGRMDFIYFLIATLWKLTYSRVGVPSHKLGPYSRFNRGMKPNIPNTDALYFSIMHFVSQPYRQETLKKEMPTSIERARILVLRLSSPLLWFR